MKKTARKICFISDKFWNASFTILFNFPFSFPDKSNTSRSSVPNQTIKGKKSPKRLRLSNPASPWCLPWDRHTYAMDCSNALIPSVCAVMQLWRPHQGLLYLLFRSAVVHYNCLFRHIQLIMADILSNTNQNNHLILRPRTTFVLLVSTHTPYRNTPVAFARAKFSFYW